MIKNIKTNNLQYLPFSIIPIPYNDELFSSWFARLSYAHYLHPKTFINLYFGLENRSLFKKNIDTSLNMKLLNRIKTMCNDKVDVFNLTLKTYSGYIQENDIEIASNRFFSDLKFCPICLRKDNVPYFRKYWKLAFSTVCTLHNCFLYDSCPQCNSKLSILKMHKDKFAFTYCSKCGFEFKKARKINVNQKHIMGIHGQANLQHIADKGYAELDNDVSVYSFYIFDVIIQLTKLIISRKNIKFINKHPLFAILKKSFNRKPNQAKSIYIQLNIKEKFALFGLIWYLFEKYPKNFTSFMKENNLTHWNMVKDIKYVSFWYENLLNDISPRYIAFGNMVTKEEIENGKKYLVSKGLDITKANLSRLFGNVNYFKR
ncbi:MAG: TniQ family protein [Sulfurovaceae bacterium]|nr:TniQ family protein [Sulfurovaceae bacterium]